jgi:DNA-3-methyladenine glycosylase II
VTWFDETLNGDPWFSAQKHLAEVGPPMLELIQRVGACTLRPRRDYFVVLAKAIFSQQISTKVADVLFGRFRDQFPGRRPTPEKTIALFRDPAAARLCGLSRQKEAYILDLARHFANGSIPTRKLSSMSDEDVIEALTCVKGIGQWTAEMFLIFTLNRGDVLPVDDLGLRAAAKRVYNLRTLPDAKRLRKLAEPWAPYRSIATWYLWRGTAPAVIIR